MELRTETTRLSPAETAIHLLLCKIVSFDKLRTSPERSRGKNRLTLRVIEGLDKLLSANFVCHRQLQNWDRIRLIDTYKKNESPLPKVGDFLLKNSSKEFQSNSTLSPTFKLFLFAKPETTSKTYLASGREEPGP